MKSQTLAEQTRNSLNRNVQLVEALVLHKQYPDALPLEPKLAQALKRQIRAGHEVDVLFNPDFEGRSLTAQAKRKVKVELYCGMIDEQTGKPKPKKAAPKKAAKKAKAAKKPAAKKAAKATKKVAKDEVQEPASTGN